MPLRRFGERKFALSSWAADGRRLAGFSWSGDEQPILVLFSLDTREYEELPARGVEPNWLSDGRRLVFLQDNRRLMLLDVETKEQRALAELPESDKISVLRLTKDERWLYFQRFKAESDIWLATLE